jgi:hypothetical protein
VIGITPINKVFDAHCETSYEAETLAIYTALLYCKKKTRIHNDCKQAVRAISKTKARRTAFQEAARELLRKKGCTLQWSPRNCLKMREVDKLTRGVL